MNREIKFRAWDKKDKRWWVAGKDGDWFYRDGTEIVPVVDVELMQFTGLRDKNGKEIYEGDIVKHPLWSTLGAIGEKNGEVKWNDKYTRWDFGDHAPQPENLEIIGNIYENPELLDNKQL